MLSARLIQSDRWVHDRLLRDATSPTSYRWAERDEAPDIAIFLVPLHHDLAAPERLHTLRPRDLTRLFIFSQADIAVPWAPGMFTSLSARHAGPEFAGGCYILPRYFGEPGGVGDMLDQVRQPPDLLWSFFGSVCNYPSVRQRIVALRDDRGLACDSQTWNDVRWAEAGDAATRRREAVATYVSGIARSKFVVAPRGKGPSSLRLFEAMRASRAPVIVSDDWLPPALIDWESCAIRIREADIGHLPTILREHEEDAESLGLHAREVWERHFSPRTMVHHVVATCLHLSEQSLRTRRRVRLGLSAIARREALRRGREVVRGERARALGR